MSTRFLSLTFALLFGCATSAATPRRDAGPGGGSPEDTLAACTDGLDGDLDGLPDCADPDCAPFSVCAGHDGGPTFITTDGGGPAPDAGFLGCAGVLSEAAPVTLPVDVVWIVDSSSSMANDARAVQDNLDDFATFIASSGIDYRVVVVSDRDFVTPSPLFAADPAHFRFVDRDVGSSAVFSRALDQFGMYGSFLRPEAQTHVVAVTDDEDDVAATSFVPMMEARLGHPFTFHAIAAVAGAFGLPCSRGFIPAAAVGDRYFEAARMTGGLELSICTSDWSSLFGTLARAVTVGASVPCEYELPAAPDGMSFDRARVNVVHTPAGGAPSTLPRSDDCGGGVAWRYDDATAPSRIVLCPAGCSSVEGVAGTVEVQLGCESVLF